MIGTTSFCSGRKRLETVSVRAASICTPDSLRSSIKNVNH
jgi:hypothetical protein